jgi:hypothetical protein
MTLLANLLLLLSTANSIVVGAFLWLYRDNWPPRR